MTDPLLAQDPLPATSAGGLCIDEPGWTNGRGKTCADYASSFCAGGQLRKEFAWLGGDFLHYPERACCECGGGSSFVAAPPPPAVALTVHGYRLAVSSYCRGADRQVKKDSFAQCEAHCASRKCACLHWADDMCHFGFTFLGLLAAKDGTNAAVRPGAESEPESIKARAAEAAAKIPPDKCGAPPPRRVPPTFYMYDGPEFMWGERLTACYIRKNGRPPWSMPENVRVNASFTEIGPAPSADLSHSLWLHMSLATHRKRQETGDGAALYIVPAFGSLSEATGSCEGTTHAQRLAAAAAVVRLSPWFQKAPKRHVVYAAAHSDDHAPLGELGSVLSRAGAIALCTSRALCSAKFARHADVPMLPLLTLMHPSVYMRLSNEVCGRGGGGRPAARRRTTIFFRGAHGTSEAAQTVRAKLYELRTLSSAVTDSAAIRADIKFTRSQPGTPKGTTGRLSAKTRDSLKAVGWKDVRLPYDVQTYAYGMLHADFCVLPRGESSNPGRRLVDAIAAGCVPLIVGDSLKMPLEKLLPYENFTIRVPESEFVRYPKTVAGEAIAAALPRLASLRRSLLQVREEMLLGTGVAPVEGNMSVARGADLVLLAAGRVFCPRTPSSLKACVDTLL